jgi:hypothetical protein
MAAFLQIVKDFHSKLTTHFRCDKSNDGLHEKMQHKGEGISLSNNQKE